MANNMKEVHPSTLKRNQVVYLRATYLSFSKASGYYKIKMVEAPWDYGTGEIYEYDGCFYKPAPAELKLALAKLQKLCPTCRGED